ncbi:MAG: alkaline shock response membrane anchor protein AmaP [Candidatus Omnitrophica bacterium]|nr:alkaline shock response membrane anchor protein AmaP [Candidatus Omnitrophota bacterium]
MRMFIRFAILFYLFIISAVGFSALAFLAHIADYRVYNEFVLYVYTDPKAGMIAGLAIAATMLISFAFARIIYGRQSQERSIFVDHPLGRVTISVSAIEDTLRRLVARSPQIKEIRPNIISSKRGLKVDIRLVLNSEVNISELTADFQEMVQRKIRDLIGKDEKVLIRIHVIKITGDIFKGKKGREDYDEAPESPLHYHGYRP